MLDVILPWPNQNYYLGRRLKKEPQNQKRHGKKFFEMENSEENKGRLIRRWLDQVDWSMVKEDRWWQRACVSDFAYTFLRAFFLWWEQWGWGWGGKGGEVFMTGQFQPLLYHKVSQTALKKIMRGHLAIVLVANIATNCSQDRNNHSQPSRVCGRHWSRCFYILEQFIISLILCNRYCYNLHFI